jgi:DNA-binding PadR family transcriptional regulator
MRLDPLDVLPLKDLALRILVTLAGGERHGGALGQALDREAGRARILPGHLYRTLDRMLEDGLIDERGVPAATPSRAPRRGTQPSRFFRLTPFGREVLRAETHRLERLIAQSRAALPAPERR